MRTPQFCALLLSFLALPCFGDSNLSWGLGLEAEATLVQPEILDSHDVASYPSEYSLETVTLGVSASWEFRTFWHPMWLGVRGSAWLVGLDGFALPFPRISATTRWEVTDWLSFGLEAPYNPGVSLLIDHHWYLFYGATDWLWENDITTRSVALQYVTEY